MYHRVPINGADVGGGQTGVAHRPTAHARFGQTNVDITTAVAGIEELHTQRAPGIGGGNAGQVQARIAGRGRRLRCTRGTGITRIRWSVTQLRREVKVHIIPGRQPQAGIAA